MFMEKKIQKKPSKPASSITGDSSTSTLATTPLTMAAPVGIWFFLLSCANTFGMFFLRAACSATKFTPNDQLTMLPNNVMRNTMPTTMNSTLPTPAMMPTASMMPESSEMSMAGMAAPMPNELNRYSAAMAMPPAMMARGICLFGFSIEPTYVVMTSKPIKLNRMMDKYVRLFESSAGRNVSGAMSFAKPKFTAYQMPRPPTTSAMPTLSTAAMLRIHAESDTFEKLRNTTIQMNASSMASEGTSPISMPVIIEMVSGNRKASDAIHSGKLIQ